jgi:hypothetical protein
MMRPMKKHFGLQLFTLFTISTTLFTAACSSDPDPAGDGDGDQTGTGGSGQTGTGGSDQTGTGGSAPTNQFPADTSEATVAAFLTAESYKTWTADAAPRDSDEVVNVHGSAMRVYFNDNAVTSHGGDASPLSMVVKELYDDQGALVGRAATLVDATSALTFYCSATSGTGCTGAAEAEPLYNDFSCSTCHGPQFYAPLP